MDVAALTELRFIVTPIYWIAALIYIVATWSRSEGPARVASIFMIVAVAFHLVEYVGRGALFGNAGGAPFTGISGFLSLAALLLGIGFIATERRLTTPALGAFTTPLIALFHTFSLVLFREPTSVPDHLRGPHLVIHITLVTIACVGLAAALVSGITYLALDAMLRWKRSGPLFRKLPNLDLLSRVHRLALFIGANMLGLGALAGALWAKSVWGFYFDWNQPKLVITLVAFLAGNCCLFAWRFPLWRGRRAAWLGVVTITLTFAAMALVGTFVNELHRFVS